MFCVIFEVEPHTQDAYFAYAGSLRPILEKIDGFVENTRYRSLTRSGLLLSLSKWKTEKALVRWRTTDEHYRTQAKGRDHILKDYHLRVGQIVYEIGQGGPEKKDERSDATEVGKGTAVAIVEDILGEAWVNEHRNDPEACAKHLGLKKDDDVQPLDWDVYEAATEPGKVVLLATYRDSEAARHLVEAKGPCEERDARIVRVLRDYGMFDRREAPQFHEEVPETDAAGRVTLHE
jgi:heme-degrading monooxygenase HmoA